MSKHVLDRRTLPAQGLRLRRFRRLSSAPRRSAQVRKLLQRADPTARARVSQFLRIARKDG